MLKIARTNSSLLFSTLIYYATVVLWASVSADGPSPSLLKSTTIAVKEAKEPPPPLEEKETHGECIKMSEAFFDEPLFGFPLLRPLRHKNVLYIT